MTGKFSGFMPEWSPFSVADIGQKIPKLAPVHTLDGLQDRLRFVAFAEYQAAKAFGLAPQIFPTAPDTWKNLWIKLAQEEERHTQLLLNRMNELGWAVGSKRVSDALFRSFDRCTTAAEFNIFMTNAEAWGQESGEKFAQELSERDPETAKVFAKIAEDERLHVQWAKDLKI